MVRWDACEWIFLGAKTRVLPESRSLVELRAPRNYGPQAAEKYIQERASELEVEGLGIPLLADIAELRVLAISPTLAEPRWEGTYTDVDRWADDLDRLKESYPDWDGEGVSVVLAAWHAEPLLLMIADKLRRLGRPWAPSWWSRPFRDCEVWDPYASFVHRTTMFSPRSLARLAMPDASEEMLGEVGTWSNAALDVEVALRLATSWGLLGPWAASRGCEGWSGYAHL